MNDSEQTLGRNRLMEISHHVACISRKLAHGRFTSIFTFHIPGIFRAIAK